MIKKHSPSGEELSLKVEDDSGKRSEIYLKKSKVKEKLGIPKTYINDGVVCDEKWRNNMGNIRPNYIKSLAAQLLEEHSDIFTTDFSQNKEFVTRYTNVESKGIRNRVAGYIVRSLRVKAIRKK